jgi:hypothetical protein
MSDRITDSRRRLYDALVPLLPAGRVSRYVPPSVVSPCIWIERHSWSIGREGAANVINVSWRIAVLTDALDGQAYLDELSANVHDATVRARFRPLQASHSSVDIGGMDQVALVVIVADLVAASTLCLPDAPPAMSLTPTPESLVSA